MPGRAGLRIAIVSGDEAENLRTGRQQGCLPALGVKGGGRNQARHRASPVLGVEPARAQLPVKVCCSRGPPVKFGQQCPGPQQVKLHRHHPLSARLKERGFQPGIGAPALAPKRRDHGGDRTGHGLQHGISLRVGQQLAGGLLGPFPLAGAEKSVTQAR